MNVIHLSWNEGLSAVYPSQVLRPMSLVGQHTGARIRLVVGSPVGEFLRRPARLAWRARKAIAENEFALAIERVPAPPARLRRLLSERVFAPRWRRTRIQPEEPVILHCRGRAAAEFGLTVRAAHPSVRVIFDCRGWEAREFLYARGFPSEDGAPADLLASSRIIEARQHAAALASDAVIVVSRPMREVAVRQWGVAEDRLTVIPCCADSGGSAVDDREAVRARLGLGVRFVVAYCGSLAAYQTIDSSIDVFQEIRKLRGEALFFAITPSPDKFDAILRERGVPEQDYKIVSAPHNEVPALLATADLALLIREECQVNEVASPVKFAEYMAAGLPVVISEGVGDYSDLVRRSGTGCVLPGTANRSAVSPLLQCFLGEHSGSNPIIRARCMEIARRDLSAERASEVLGGLYQALWRDLSGIGPSGRPTVGAYESVA